jgi:hypothetical protein
MNWSIADFVIAAAILLIAGMVYWIIIKKIHSNKNRVIGVSVLIVVLVLVWTELAVGLFNTPLGGS